MAAGSERRARRRRESEHEILALARVLLAESGTDGLTLRGLAHRLGMAPSGVHYYFAARDDLVAALVVEAFHEMAEAVQTATASSPRSTHERRWTAGATAYAQWARTQPALFELAHSRTASRLTSAPGLLDAKDRVVQALMAPLLEAVRDGRARVPAAATHAVPAVRDQLRAWRRATHSELSEEVLLAALLTYIALQGQILLVLSGSLPAELLRDDGLLQAHTRALLSGWSPSRATHG